MLLWGAQMASATREPVLATHVEKAGTPWHSNAVRNGKMPKLKSGEVIRGCVTCFLFDDDVANGTCLRGRDNGDGGGRFKAYLEMTSAGICMHKMQTTAGIQLGRIMGAAQLLPSSEENQAEASDAPGDVWAWLDTGDEGALQDLQTPVEKRAKDARKKVTDVPADGDENVMLRGMDFAYDELANANSNENYGIFKIAIDHSEQDFAKKMLEVRDISNTRVELYHEPLLAKDIQAEKAGVLPKNCLGMRAWLWLVGPATVNEEEDRLSDFSFDTGLDMRNKLNRNRDIKAKKDTKKKEKEELHYTDTRTNIYHDWIRGVLPAVFGQKSRMTDFYRGSKVANAFKTKSGSVRKEISMFNKELLQKVDRRAFHMTEIFDPMNKLTDFHQPAIAGLFQYEEQLDLGSYFSGSPDFPTDYLETKKRMLEEQATALAPLRAGQMAVKCAIGEHECIANRLKSVITETEPDEHGNFIVGNEELNIECITARISECEGNIHQLNDEFKCVCRSVVAAYKPLKTYLKSVWEKKDAAGNLIPLWRHGINFNGMPEIVVSKCFWSIPFENFSSPSGLHHKGFWARHWEAQLRKEHTMRFSKKEFDKNRGSLDSRYLRVSYECLVGKEKRDEDASDDEDLRNELGDVSAYNREELTGSDMLFVEDQSEENISNYFKVTDHTETPLHRFGTATRADHDAFLEKRERARSGDIPAFAFVPFFKIQQKLMQDYTQRIICDPEMDRTVETVVGFLISPEAGVLGNEEDLQRVEMKERLDASADMGDEAHQLIMQFLNIAFETSFTHRPAMDCLHCCMDSLNPREIMRNHFFGWGAPGVGKSRFLHLFMKLLPKGMIEIVNSETPAAMLNMDPKDSQLIGVQGADEASQDWRADAKTQGLNIFLDRWKMRLSEGVSANDMGWCAKKENGELLRGVTKSKKLVRKAHVQFVNSENVVKDVNNAILDRCHVYHCMTIKMKERTAALIDAANITADISNDSENVYWKSMRSLVNPWCLMTHLMGVLGYFTKGSMKMDMHAFYVFFLNFNNANRKRGLPDMSNRQAHRAKLFAESIAWERITTRLFQTPHAVFGNDNSKGLTLSDLFTSIRLVELRMVVRPADAFKAVITVMHADRTDEVAHVLPALCKLVRERNDMLHSVMFGDRIIRSATKQIRGQGNLKDSIDNDHASVDLDYHKFRVTGENGITKFCSEVAARTEGAKLTGTGVYNVLKFMEQSDTWGTMKHYPFDIAFLKSGAHYKTLLQCQKMQDDGDLVNVVTNSNLDKIGDCWRNKHKTPMGHYSGSGHEFYPFENRHILDATMQESGEFSGTSANGLMTKRSFMFETAKDGYISISSKLLVLAQQQQGNLSHKAAEDLVREVSNSNMTSGLYAYTGIGMADVDTNAAHVLNCCRIDNDPEKLTIYPNLKHVDVSNHRWLCGENNMREEAYEAFATCIDPNKPLSSLRHHKRVEEIINEDPILSTAHTLFMADFDEAILLMGPGIIEDAFKTDYMKKIVGEDYDICFPPDNNQYKSSQLKRALRFVLNTPREQGGYLDFMRHCNPWLEGEATVIERTENAMYECERCIEEVTCELIALSKCKVEGQLYLNVINMGNHAAVKEELRDANNDLECAKEQYEEAERCGASGDTLSYLEGEVDTCNRKVNELRKWMYARMKDIEGVKHTVAQKRGIDLGKYNNIFHEQSVRNHRTGAFSPRGHRDWKRAEAKRLLVLRKHINGHLANDVVIPQHALDSVYYRRKRTGERLQSGNERSNKRSRK